MKVVGQGLSVISGDLPPQPRRERGSSSAYAGARPRSPERSAMGLAVGPALQWDSGAGVLLFCMRPVLGITLPCGFHPRCPQHHITEHPPNSLPAGYRGKKREKKARFCFLLAWCGLAASPRIQGLTGL